MASLALTGSKPAQAGSSSGVLASMNHYDSLLGRVYGWCLSICSYAICVLDEKTNKNFYINVKDVVRHLCRVDNAKISSETLASSEKINRLVLEILSPSIRDEVSSKTLEAFFRDFRSSLVKTQLKFAKDLSAAEGVAVKQLTTLKNRDLKILRFERAELVSKLKPGDVLFKKMPDDSSHIVALGQRIVRVIVGEEREAYKYSHAAIYLGNGKIAEATPAHGCDVRITDLTHSKFALKEGSGIQYIVARCADSRLAKQAADVAKKVAGEVKSCGVQEGSQCTPHKYSNINAGRSIYHSQWFGPFARHRYIKQYIDDSKKEMPVDFIARKKFFCSYFVGYCYQTAESRKVIPEILGADDEPLKAHTTFGKAISRGIWARLRRYQTWNQMSEKVKMQYDAAWLTPQDLRNFMRGHRELFKDEFLVRARGTFAG